MLFSIPITPIVRALAQMTPDRTKTMMEALLRIATSFLMKNCPQKPARIDTDIKYIAENETRDPSVSFCVFFAYFKRFPHV